MTILDNDVLSQRIAAVELHLRRVEEKLPRTVGEFCADADASDSVTLHLWLAVQIVIDLEASTNSPEGVTRPRLRYSTHRQTHAPR